MSPYGVGIKPRGESCDDREKRVAHPKEEICYYFHDKVGWLRLHATDKGVSELTFVPQPHSDHAQPPSPVMKQLIRELDVYFSGAPVRFLTPVDISWGSPFLPRSMARIADCALWKNDFLWRSCGYDRKARRCAGCGPGSGQESCANYHPMPPGHQIRRRLGRLRAGRRIEAKAARSRTLRSRDCHGRYERPEEVLIFFCPEE